MTISRRALLAGSGALAAVAATRALSAELELRPLTLIDSQLLPVTLRSVGVSSDAATRSIGLDLVRQWHDGLGAEIAQARGAVAYVRWDKSIVLAGLAREVGLRANREQLGLGIFQIILR